MGEAAMISQLPSGSGSSIPSHASRVDPLRPAWPSCSPIFAWLWAWTNSTIRCQAGTCSGLYMPVHPGEIRPSRDTSVICEDEARAAHGTRPEVHQMPIVGRAVHGAVLAHRGHDHAVHEQHVPQPKRREQG